MNITPEAAAQALRDIDSSRSMMRAAVRAHRGHLHLWLWGSIWMIIALISWKETPRFWIVTEWLSAAGVVGSFLIGPPVADLFDDAGTVGLVIIVALIVAGSVGEIVRRHIKTG